MTESAHAHICRYIRSEFEGGRIGAVAAAMALHELGLPDSDPHAIQMRIEARWQTGSHAEALEISGQAFARWPKRTWYHYALCRSALLNGSPEDANRIATEALAGEPLLPPVSTGMAEILVLLGRCGEASGFDRAAKELHGPKFVHAAC